MADFLSLPNSVLASDIFSFLPVKDLLALRVVSRNLKNRVDNILSLRLEYLTQKLSETENFQLPNDLKHFGASSMQACISKLNTIHPASVQELKTFANPPSLLKEVMELVYIILASNPRSPSWTEICRDLLNLNILTNLANYDLKPMKISLYKKAEYYLSNIDINKVRAFSMAAEIFGIWSQNVVAVNRMYHEDESGKAYFENEQRKGIIKKEMKILDNLANVGTRMKNTNNPSINEAKTISPTKQVTTSTSRPVVKASTSKEESKKVKEVKKSAPAQPLSKLIRKPAPETAKKPSAQGIEGLMITPAMNLRSSHNKK